MFNKIKYVLLQVRKADDPMRRHEVECFARELRCDAKQISVYDLLSGVPSRQELDQVDIVLIGGSGDYSVAEGGTWLPRALATMQELHEWSKPTFASCWGFQAMARALGGEVVTDISRAELGTIQVRLTEAGKADALFAELGATFQGQMGHQDIVTRLPADALLLASTDRVENEAYCFPGKPIYCTQFHPELNRADLLMRAATYPQYVERIGGVTLEEFAATCVDTPKVAALLPRFVEHVAPTLLREGVTSSRTP